MRKSSAKVALVSVPVVLGVGLLMGQLSNSGYGNPWFDALAKPAAMPPGWVFGAAWTILYALLGFALALLLTADRSSRRSAALGLFLGQLVLNYAWSPVFFALHQPKPALALIVAMAALSIGAAAAAARVRPLASWLMLPYLAWLSFATYLNFEIVRLNPAS
jgi:tryptophan-rich sensory protein